MCWRPVGPLSPISGLITHWSSLRSSTMPPPRRRFRGMSGCSSGSSASTNTFGFGSHRRLRMSTAPHPRRLGFALAVIAVAQLMVVLDVAIVNVALPSIQRELHFAATDLEWVVNAYAIAFGGLLLFGGRTGDLFGRRRMFIIGALMFTAGSMAGGLATSSTFLIAARAAQGVGAALLAPTALSLLAATFSQGTQRNRALGVYSAVSAGG